VCAVDGFKPYLHNSQIPEHPDLKMYGEYSTQLFSGSAIYNYPIDVPKGVNNLQPSLKIMYNSLSVKERPTILGSSWSITQDLIYRNVNGTFDNISDDKFVLVLDGNNYDLVYSNGQYVTGVNYYFRIQNFSNYWIVTKQDGTQYRFGYNNSRVDSNLGFSYTSKWFLDLVTDTHGNNIYYNYLSNPNAEDFGTLYLDNILYNNDRNITFSYESVLRPDNRIVFKNGLKIDESRRLSDINIFVNNSILKRYHLSYVTLNVVSSFLSNISYIGSDNVSILHNIVFDYYSSTPGFNNVSGYVPPILFSDHNHKDFGVRFVDVNNDGFPDILEYRNTSSDLTFLNNKIGGWVSSNSWLLPMPVVDQAGTTDLGVRFADVNKDGYVDILQSQAGTRNVYLNNKTGWFLSSWIIPIDFVDFGGNDQGVILEDVNGDGRVDIIKSSNGVRQVYLNNDTGWFLSSWNVPVDFFNGTSTQSGVRLVDLNGDGLPDIVQSENLNAWARNTWLNNGSGWNNYSLFISPVAFTNISYQSDMGVRFDDVNNDGLVDILEQFSNGTNVQNTWLNNGSGWVLNNSFVYPEPFNVDGYNIARRLSDVNGDGFGDIVVSHQNNAIFTNYTYIRNNTLPYLLRSIRNEYGGMTFINYTTSTLFNNSLNGTSQIGFSMYVVNNVTKNNSLDNDFGIFYSIGYNYSNGMYDYYNSEFRGFGTAIEKTNFSVVKHYFYQDAPRKGIEFSTENYDLGGNIFSKNIKDYSFVFDNGFYNVSLNSVSDYLYDNTSDPVVNNKTYFYNQFGNYGYIIDYGDSNISGDELYYNYTYAFDTQDWIINKVAKEDVFDSGNILVKESRNYYDNKGFTGIGPKGELTKTVNWNNNGNDSFNYYSYDDYGNMISKTDSLGNIEKWYYDSSHIYPSSYINALGHVTLYNYNISTGNLNYEEKNGIRKNYLYDIFGRISKEVLPYDSIDLPTKSYNYTLDGVAPEKMSVKQRTTANKTQDVSYFYDGFGNLIQVKQKIENNVEVVKNIFYDGLFRVNNEQNPYFSTYSSVLSSVNVSMNKTFYSYDPLNRVIKIVNPDGTNKTVIFNKHNISDFDENYHKHTYVLDGRGRIVNVYEYNVDPVLLTNDTYTTAYSYDANDNLIKIIDNEGNIFSFNYDSLGRKISMSDPDLGTWAYTYDADGNLIRQNDSIGNLIKLGYDGLNRITSKNSSDSNQTFTYDTDFYGTLSKVTQNGVNKTYQYDDRLRVIKETKYMDNVTFDTNFIYDSMDRLISVAGVSGDLDYVYNLQGKMQKVLGYANNSNYNAFGSMINRTYDNGLLQTYTYTPDTNRITRIAIPTFLNISYTYDNVGNILTINDVLQNRIHTLTYDSLDRMVSAKIGVDNYTYSYNSLGNMLKIVRNNESKKFVYNGLAHAPSSIINGSSGVDVYAPKDVDSGSKNRTFQFYIINDNYPANLTRVNITVSFGDGVTYTNNTLNITSNYQLFSVNHNYTKGGNYTVTFNITMNGINDYQQKNIKFGILANNLTILYKNISNYIFEFVAKSNINETIQNVTWNCSDGINSTILFNLSNQQLLLDYLQQNYTAPGSKNFLCQVFSTDGNQSNAISFNIDALKLENYDVLYTNVSRRIISYDAKNYYYTLMTNISMSVENSLFSKNVSVNNNEKVMVFIETNHSSDNVKDFAVDLSATNTNVSYDDLFTLRGVSIKNYNRVIYNGTSQNISFDIRNDWNSGIVYWNISDLGISNSTFLNNNQSVRVSILTNYSSTQGNKQPQIIAYTSSYIDRINEFFEIRPLKIDKLLTLSESQNSTITEIVVKNNLNNSQYFNWKYYTGESTITGNSITNITTNTFIYIQTNYTSAGVYRTNATINASSYNDSDIGVVVS
jgi:YD repeat-containing protein